MLTRTNRIVPGIVFSVDIAMMNRIQIMVAGVQISKIAPRATSPTVRFSSAGAFVVMLEPLSLKLKMNIFQKLHRLI
jgi:hypothetical protein